MSGSDKPLPLPGSGHAHALGIFPMPPYPYFIPHMLGGISPPALPALPVSGYSTPSPAIVLQIFRGIWFLAVSFECYVCVIMLLDVSDHVVVFGESTRWKFET
ncbi:retinoic acid receptor alpha-B [Tachysurus ichikawai]